MSDHTAPRVADAACSPSCARDYEATHDHQTVPACSCCHDHETAHSHDHGHNHAQVDADLGASDCGCTSCACHSHSGPEDADHEKRELLLYCSPLACWPTRSWNVSCRAGWCLPCATCCPMPSAVLQF